MNKKTLWMMIIAAIIVLAVIAVFMLNAPQDSTSSTQGSADTTQDQAPALEGDEEVFTEIDSTLEGYE